MITQTLKLNLIPGQVLPRVNVSQYDAGTRTLQMLLYNGDQAFNIPVGYGGFVQGTKPDRTGFQYAATVTEGSNVVTLVVTQQMAAVSGEVTCELVIANGDDRIATVNFILYVEPAALADDTVISDTELPLIEEAAELAQRIDGIVQQVNEDAQTASNAATAAQTAADEAEEWGTHPPYIGANGNWYVYDPKTETYQDSGIKAQGPLSGLTDVEITNAQDGQEITYDGTTQKWKNTSKIQTLTNQVKDMNNVLGAKNLLPYPYSQTTRIANGITFTDNYDGSITLNGTNTGTNTFFVFHKRDFSSTAELFSKLKKMNTSFKLLGGNDIPLVVYNIDFYDSSNTFISSVMNRNDTPTVFTIPSNAEFMDIFIRCGKNMTYSDLTIYPMLYLASITDDTYEPYSKTNQQLTQDTTALLDNVEVNGAVNMLPNNATSQVVNGITFTVNDDGTVTANGTATANTEFILLRHTDALANGLIEKISGKTVRLSGCPDGGSNSTYHVRKWGAGSTGTYYDTGEGVVFTPSQTSLSDNQWNFQIRIMSGTTVSNLIFKPMLTVPSYNGDYVPYAKSNKELTEESVLFSNKSVTVKGIGLSFQKCGNIVAVTFGGTSNEVITANTTFYSLTDAMRTGLHVDQELVTGQRMQIDRANQQIVFSSDIPSGTALRGTIVYASDNFTALS